MPGLFIPGIGDHYTIISKSWQYSYGETVRISRIEGGSIWFAATKTMPKELQIPTSLLNTDNVEYLGLNNPNDAIIEEEIEEAKKGLAQILGL